MKISKLDEIRFWSRVDVKQKEACWYWRNSKHKFGYGWFRINKKTYLAHRVSLIIFTGEEKNKFVLHSCDNPGCCNPYHLRWGDQKENIKDCIKRKRKTDPPTFYGENHPTSKLTWKDVNKIRERISEGESVPQIHSDYSMVAVNTLYRIRNYATWKVREK